MSSQRRMLKIYLPGFVVATIAIVSVLWSFRLTLTNVVAGGAGIDYVEAAMQFLAWLAGHSDVSIEKGRLALPQGATQLLVWPAAFNDAVAGKGVVEVHPLYGIMMLILSAFVGQLDLAGGLISFLSWAAAIPLFFFACKRLNGVKAAYLSTVLLCTNKWMIGTSYTMSYLSLFVLLSISCLFASVELVRLLRSGKGRVSKRLLILSGVAGLLFALLYWTRPEGLGIFVSLLVFLGLWAAVGRRTDIGVATIVVTVVFLVISGPYSLFIKQHLGHWFFTSKVSAVDGGTVKYLQRAGLGEYFRGHYMDNAVKYYKTYTKMLGPVGTAMIMLLGLMTILPPITLNKVRLEQLLPLLFLTPLLALFTLWHTSRYAIPYLLVLVMWVGRGAIELGQRLPKRHATFAIASVLIALSVYKAKEVRFWPHSHIHLTFKGIGVWMKETLAGDLERETILGGKGAYIASFYAGTNFANSTLLEISDPEHFVEYMRANKIRYLLVDEHYTPSYHPNLAFLLTDFGAARNLGLSVVREEQGQTNKSVLYEVQLDTPP